MSVKLGFKAEDIIAEGRVTNDDINKINIWIKEQPKIPIITDEEVINFLLSNDNDQEKTKNTIKAFFKIRNEGPSIFNNRFISDENSESLQSFAYFGVAPKRTKDNCAVILGKFHNATFQNFHLAKFYKFLYMTLDAAIYSSPPSGLNIVIDMEGFGITLLPKLRIHAISVFFRYLQEALPVQLKQFHILNTVYFIDKIMILIKPFLSDHMNEMLNFHKKECNMEEFFKKYVAKEFLPEDFGGELPCMKDLTDQLMEKFSTMETYFAAEEERRSSILES